LSSIRVNARMPSTPAPFASVCSISTWDRIAAWSGDGMAWRPSRRMCGRSFSRLRILTRRGFYLPGLLRFGRLVDCARDSGGSPSPKRIWSTKFLLLKGGSYFANLIGLYISWRLWAACQGGPWPGRPPR
jgi:hypothetical protein